MIFGENFCLCAMQALMTYTIYLLYESADNPVENNSGYNYIISYIHLRQATLKERQKGIARTE